MNPEYFPDGEDDIDSSNRRSRLVPNDNLALIQVAINILKLTGLLTPQELSELNYHLISRLR